MGYRYHVRKTNPKYGSGFFNHCQGEFPMLLDALGVEYDLYDDDNGRLEIYKPSLIKAIDKLKAESESEPNAIWLEAYGNSYNADEIIEAFTTWLDELEHTEDCITIESF